MGYLIQFQINLFALTILIVLFLFIHMSQIRTFSTRLINQVLIATAFAIIDEPLTWVLDGKLFPGAYFLEYSTNVMLFLIGPIIGGLLMSYVDYRLFHDTVRIQRKWYYQHASILTAVILAVNYFHPLYFSVDFQTNSFHSGGFNLFHYAVLGGLYIYMFLFIIKHRKRATRKEALIYSIFFLLPIIGMLTQLLSSKLHFAWTSVVLGLLVIYVFLETIPSDEDYLTKLYNRKSFDTHLQYLIQSRKPFSLIVLDLDSFKEINDQYGHKIGDEVLIGFANALKHAFSPKGLVARLGGDEFAVFIHSDQIENQISELKAELRGLDDTLISNLSFSYGYHMMESDLTADALYTIADHKMYDQKKLMKNKRVEHPFD
ncbi:MAG: GGDEF domain-containing protein [Spirochaetae bacterium HGW-Spirochaetae-8]|nr:MAG: GGDEF domain-containing protein [Spirochaetae bacterium HGW-Spirochaetae-8]